MNHIAAQLHLESLYGSKTSKREHTPFCQSKWLPFRHTARLKNTFYASNKSIRTLFSKLTTHITPLTFENTVFDIKKQTFCNKKPIKKRTAKQPNCTRSQCYQNSCILSPFEFGGNWKPSQWSKNILLFPTYPKYL